jgi:hypothetical protein
MDPYPYQKRIPPFTTGKPVFKGLEHDNAGSESASKRLVPDILTF